jgi:hypothetical protein
VETPARAKAFSHRDFWLIRIPFGEQEWYDFG